MRSLACSLPLLLIATLSSSVSAHLGEVHPGGFHDYFPPIPETPLPVGVEAIPNTRGNWWPDAQYFPDGSGRLLMAGRSQQLRLVSNSGSTNFLQAGEEVGWEVEGMAALEFHPGFANEASPGYGKFYTITIDRESTADPDFKSSWFEGDHHRVITEWTMSDITANTFSGTSREVMRFQMGNKFHNVNDLLFDDDEMMFIAIGEDNVSIQSSALENVFGKILRIDPLGTDGVNQQYGIPMDNPFVGQEGVAPEVFAYGLRNPWRMTIDSETGEMWAMDVGYLDIEEVDRIVPGGDYGWPTKEGSLLTAVGGPKPDLPDPVTGKTKAEEMGFIEPVFEYDHTDGRSVIGGVVYRGDEIPFLQGKVVFADLGAVGPYLPRVFYGDPETGEMFELISHKTLDEVWGLTCNIDGESVSCPMWSINEDPDGEVLILGKSIMRIVPVPADFNHNGMLDASDIDLLSEQVRQGSHDLNFDSDRDGDVDADDRTRWINHLKNTYVGDSNLDGEFNSSDLVAVFRAAEFEDGRVANSTWATGDWNGDQEFDSGDLVLAFRDGGFEQGPRSATSVPEPTGGLMLVLGLVGVLGLGRCR